MHKLKYFSAAANANAESEEVSEPENREAGHDQQHAAGSHPLEAADITVSEDPSGISEDALESLTYANAAPAPCDPGTVCNSDPVDIAASYPSMNDVASQSDQGIDAKAHNHSVADTMQAAELASLSRKAGAVRNGVEIAALHQSSAVQKYAIVDENSNGEGK